MRSFPSSLGYGSQLKIRSKRLRSGKYQVRFEARVNDSGRCYGYTLAEAEETLKEVVFKIKKQLALTGNKSDYHHLNLYSIHNTPEKQVDFLMFD
ncbi:MAG TPA: hypothetical protein ACFCUD_05290 [Cyclobacteriaceae bacterium]